jgi:hypothetical protein
MKLQIASRIHPKDQISLKHIMFPKATTVKILSKVVVHAKKATFLGTLSPRHFSKESGDYSTPQSLIIRLNFKLSDLYRFLHY